MSIGAYLNLPVGFVMDRQHHQSMAGYKSDESSSNSILWDLDSSSLIVPSFFLPTAEFRPLNNNQQPLVDTMRREISEESGYQTALDEGSSSWASDYWLTSDQQPVDYHQGWPCPSSDNQQQVNEEEMAYWLQQPSTSSGLPADAFPIPPPYSTLQTATGRSESTSSDDSTPNEVYVPSGKLSLSANKKRNKSDIATSRLSEGKLVNRILSNFREKTGINLF